MKSRDGSCRATAMGSGCEAEVPRSTRMIAAAVSATGAAECITMQSGQWSASVEFE